MNNFSYARAESAPDAVELLGQNAKFLGGGTNLVDLMRENIESPNALVDVTPFSTSIEDMADGGLKIGGAVKNTDLANDRRVRERYPLLSEAILAGASGQIRNMATTAGNLLQRTRCYYFYDGAANCNKRTPGAGCDALGGFNRIHAILGASDSCIATHPSDMCVAMAALGARVNVVGSAGERQIELVDFHRLPGDTPQIETNLLPGELITSVEIPALPFASNSRYRKVRDRASYAFALVSVAAALEIESGNVKNVRIALGGVALKPWRATLAEAALVGAPADQQNFERAAQIELEDARGYGDNDFKIELARRVIVSVLSELAHAQNTGGATQ